MQLTQEYLKSTLNYEPTTGVFTWCKRPLNHFKNIQVCNMWNAKFAGTRAGCINHGYLRIKIDSKVYQAHRLAWLYVYGVWPVDLLDHVNCDPADNRIVNLREANMSENKRNSGPHKDNRSGYKGVSPKGNGWRAEIWIEGNRIRLGTFTTPEEAYSAYCSAAEKHHGKFARVV